METHIPERRIVLRGMALLALSLAGCQKKEETAPQTQAPEAGAPTAPAPQAGGTTPGDSAAGAAAQGAKLSKAQVQYQDQPKGDQQCSNCMHFVAESNTCKVVDGQISPSGWCTIWAKKA